MHRLDARNGIPKADGKPNGLTNGRLQNLKTSETSNGLGRQASLASPTGTPLIPPFMVSSPGKVIVFGEHAVVHGKMAMAASISLRSYLLVTTLGKTERTISLLFPDIGLEHTWNIDDLPWQKFKHPDKKRYYYDLVSSLDEDLVKATQQHTLDVSSNLPEEQRKVHQNAALMFLYLFLSLGSQSNPGCLYTLRSTIPVGAGLGSSASIGVCISAALLLQIRALAGPHPDQPIDESNLQIERINRWAFVGELCIHGNPSGVDNTVASGGRAVTFKRADYTKPPIVKFIRNFPELPLLVVDTRQPRSTAAEVAKVATLKKTQPVITGLILEAIDKVTESAIDVVSSDGFDATDPVSMGTLGQLVNVNHGLLASLGVSHPKLEKIRELTDAANIGYTKLTGAGGGGCAITLIKPGCDQSRVKILDEQLDAAGFKRYETQLGGDGVGVLFPAILKNDSEEEGGEEIDQEKFLNAEGREGVEKLVGVGLHQKREGWKFWR
ncbi:MAG: hypothetical protein GOMPHAMPRED_002747 [Gomphillus americanus]|uniref:Mevalonate kinase n=1 Tax=Gomphillus americanus TaxID=1940652 RepID=A0A8H3FGL8_9LECA|nr:MAG: hypothetical protein GOMPHAMPRED_002747 [Gomphillus americanus]